MEFVGRESGIRVEQRATRDEPRITTQRRNAMPFSTTRGRPRKSLPPGADLGTPELIFKRLHQSTAEVIDICLARGIIDDAHHWCAVHLRWLYTLRHGAPGCRALDVTEVGGIEHAADDPEWRVEREKEYAEALEALAPAHYTEALLSICVHNERPAFLVMPLCKRPDYASAGESPPPPSQPKQLRAEQADAPPSHPPSGANEPRPLRGRGRGDSPLPSMHPSPLHEIAKLRESLDILAELWGRK